MRDMTMWRDGAREDVIRVVMVDPWNLDTVRGELPSLELSGCSITEGYYTDNRVSGKVLALDEGAYIKDSWLRIILECPGYGYSEELATLIPSQLSHERAQGGETVDYTLQSVLWGISKDTLPSHFTIGKGATTSQVFKRICSTVKKQCLWLPGANEHRYDESVVYEVGDSFLSSLYDIADTSRNRLSVDGHGRITMGKYVEPSRREPDWELDADDSRTMVLSDAITWDESQEDVANRSIVIYKNNDKEIVGSANSKSNTRGFTIAETHTENDMTPATLARANELAKQYLGEDSEMIVKRKVRTLYFPCHQGDIVSLYDGKTRIKGLVDTIEASFGDMTMSLTLKEV